MDYIGKVVGIKMGLGKDGEIEGMMSMEMDWLGIGAGEAD